MAEKPTFTTIDEYIATFPADIQAKLQEMRAIIRAAAPDATEKISYKMPAFDRNGTLVNFAAWKNHLALYPTPDGVPEFVDDLAHYDTSGKGSIRFPLNEPLPEALITRMVQYRVEVNEQHAAAKKRK